MCALSLSLSRVCVCAHACACMRMCVSMYMCACDFIFSSPVPPEAKCAMCGWNPIYRCHKCGKDDPSFQNGVIHHFCESCVELAHGHPNRRGHSPEAIERTSEPIILDLISVVCIEKSHYTCFTWFDNSWVFFDSMAERTGRVWMD